MPVYNITIPDTSPLIVYSNGFWRDSSSSHDDIKWLDYVNGTFHATPDDNALATITFNGSAVYAFGAKRSNHGDYWAILDGTTHIEDGFSTQDTFNTKLFSQDGLDGQQHQLALQNKWTWAQTWLDIDYMVLTVGDGDSSTVSSDVTLDDVDTNITYSAGWETSLDGLDGSYYDQTIHRTNVSGAWASILFYGNAISLYGTTAFYHGLFSITLDGTPVSELFNGSAPVGPPRRQNLLYYSGGLSSDGHNLTVINADSNTPALWLDLDKVVVSTWHVDPTTSAIPPPKHSGSKSGLSTGVIAAIALAALMVVLLCTILCLLIRWRWRQRHRHGSELVETSAATPMRPTQFTIEPFALETGASDPTETRQGTTHSPLISKTMPARRIARASTNLSNSSVIVTATPQPVRVAEVTTNPHSDLPPPGYEEATAPV